MEHSDVVHLLLTGQLAVSAVAGSRFGDLIPVVKAVRHMLGKGELFPLSPERVWDVAGMKYNAPSAIKDVLYDTLKVQDKVRLEVVQQRLTLESVAEVTSAMIQDGTYEPRKVLQLFDSSIIDVTVRKVTKMAREEMRMLCRTGLPEVDCIIGGLGAELCIVGARPKAGKSNFLLNVAARQPEAVTVLYVAVADYDYGDLCDLLNTIDPDVVDRGNVHICDLTGRRATPIDVERAIKQTKPKLTIIDRAEKMVVTSSREKENDQIRLIGELFDEIRRYAKRYGTAIICDSQYGADDDEDEEPKMDKQGRPLKLRRMTASRLYGDKTMRAGTLDLFFGLRRTEGAVHLDIEGRRQGRLPASTRIEVDRLGVYQ